MPSIVANLTGTQAFIVALLGIAVGGCIAYFSYVKSKPSGFEKHESIIKELTSLYELMKEEMIRAEKKSEEMQEALFAARKRGLELERALTSAKDEINSLKKQRDIAVSENLKLKTKLSH